MYKWKRWIHWRKNMHRFTCSALPVKDWTVSEVAVQVQVVVLTRWVRRLRLRPAFDVFNYPWGRVTRTLRQLKYLEWNFNSKIKLHAKINIESMYKSWQTWAVGASQIFIGFGGLFGQIIIFALSRLKSIVHPLLDIHTKLFKKAFW